MQGQRGIVGSLPETLDFDHGPAAGNAVIDQPICWNSMRSPAENRLADFMLSPIPPNNTYVNSVDQERRNLNGWSLGQSSSSSAQNELSHEEQKAENGWSASVSCYAGGGPRLEERRYEPINVVSLDNATASPFAEGSNSHTIPQNLDLNVADNCQVMDGSNVYKSSGLESDQTLPASGSNAFQHPSGSGGGYLMEENDGRPSSSVDGRRHSCKRKAVEGNIGQSSVSGSSSFFHRSENSGWPGVPARDTAGGSLTISSPLERGIPRLGTSVRRIGSENIPDSVSSARGESSQRNFRVRINPFSQESVPPSLFSAGSTRRSGGPSSHQSSRVLPVDHSLDSRSSQGIDGTTSQNHPVVIPVPTGPQNVQPFGWNESSGSRTGNSSGSITLGDREEARSTGRNRWQGPSLIPATVTESRAPVTNPGRTVTGGNVGLPGNGASSSRTGSSLGAHSLSASSWASHPIPPHRNSRRLAEYVRRSLFSSIGTESGAQSSTHSPLHAGPSATAEETLLPSGSNNQGHHRYSRLASLMERQGDGVFGIPYPLRTLGAVGEGRSRLVVSEIRNVLDLMRRGESLRFEDVMILDQSVLFGMADIHDRHRDMRMDVDNMSYEELLALEERIGNVSTGLSEETIGSRLKQRKYSTSAGAEVKAEPCCICQEEYNDGEGLGTLDCGHDFHTDCIKQWLKLKNWCPICKTTGLAT